MHLNLFLLLTAYASWAFGATQPICTKDIYAVLVPLVKNYAPAQSYCSAKHPVPATTSTVKAAALAVRGRRAVSSSATSTVKTTITTTRSSTTSTLTGQAATWASIISKYESLLDQICTCIETPKTVTVTSSTTTTSVRSTGSSGTGGSTSNSGTGVSSSSTSTRTNSGTSATSSNTSSVTTGTGTGVTTTSATTNTNPVPSSTSSTIASISSGSSASSSSTSPAVSSGTSSAGSTSTTSSASSDSSSVTTLSTSTTTTSTGPIITDGVDFQVALSFGSSRLAKRASSFIGITGGQLVLVSSQSQGASFTIQNGALLISGSTSAIGHAAGTGTLPLQVYSSVGTEPVQITFSIGANNALVVSDGSFCVSGNNVYDNVYPYTDQSCVAASAQASAGGLVASTTSKGGQYSSSSAVYSTLSTATTTPTCARPAATSLVQNPSFETGDLLPWVCTGGTCRVSSGNYVAHQGSGVFVGNAVQENGGIVVTQPLNLSCVPAATTITMSIWVKPITLTNTSCCGQFCSMSMFWDANQYVNHDVQFPTPNPDGSYSWFQHTQTAKSTQQNGELLINWNCPGTFIADDITVTYS